MLLYIIRHGDPIYNPDSLTPKGHLQAKALAKRLAVHGLDRIYASPLIRAQQTATPTAELLGLPIQTEDWTSESRTAADFYIHDDERKLHGWIFHTNHDDLRTNTTSNCTIDNWHTFPPFTEYPEKNFKAGYQRIIDASDEFLARHGYKREGAVYKITNPNEERIAVFCHQGFGTTWLSHLLNIPPQLFWRSFDLSHSSVTVLTFSNRENGFTSPMCLQLSDLSHIYREGLPFMYNNSIPL